jgi:acetylornithine deacetylase/succinyl-diaminopimelate desuccinylase-like protein
LTVDRALEYAKRNRDRHLAELKEFLAIPTISTLSEHTADMKRGAAWLEQLLVSIGLRNVKVIPSTGHPLVYGDRTGMKSAPTVLLYGHYDVVPVDPIGEWISPPFEPEIRGDYIFARGATDMKTNAIAVLAAVEACLKSENLSVNLKVLFEGEEEGTIATSYAINDFVKSHHDELKCDFVLETDGSIAGKNLPSLTYGTRGVLSLRVWIRGPEVDLHSGEFGGAVHNPAQVLCELIAGMHDQDGRVTLPAFLRRRATSQRRGTGRISS